ncbi:TolC family protein [Flavobacterium sp.]|uniref:TolC family protein n=1 Tax=Flavobacterium sp. TaxID=239 RepID=UPI003D0A3DA9
MKKSKIVVSFFTFLTMSAFSQTKKWTLEECVNHAIVNNNAIQQSLLDVKTINLAKNDAIGNFLPSLNANAGHSWNMGLSNDPLTGVKTNQTTESSNFGASLNLDLYKGLQNVNQFRKANLNKIAAQYQLTKIQEDVTLNVVNGFLQILFNKENLKAQKEQLAFDNKQLQRTTELVNAGVVPKGDLLDVKATIATDEQRIVSTENALLLTKLSLAQLLQLRDYEIFDIVDTDNDVTKSTVLSESVQSIIAKAKLNRTEIKLAEVNKTLAQSDIAIAKGAYQPRLSFFYGLGTSILHRNTLIPKNLIPSFENQFKDNIGHSIGLQLSIPILNGLTVRNSVSRAKIAFQKSKLNFEQKELDLERTIYTAYSDTQGAEKAYATATATLEARQKAMQYAKERYDVGLMNVFDYNQAQTLYVSAQSEVLRTKFDYIFRTKILEFYFGIPIAQKLK